MEEAGGAINGEIWCLSLDCIVDKISKLVVVVWERINGITSSIRIDPS